MPFPDRVLLAGKIATSNQGNKPIIVTRDATTGDYAPVSVRCDSAEPDCVVFDRAKGQIAPDTVENEPFPLRNALTEAALGKLREAARAAGTLTASCPTTLTGRVVFIDGPANCSYVANSVFNTQTAPGIVVINNGTLTLGGGSTFWGILYAHNAQDSTEDVITLTGTTQIYGGIMIDGPGGCRPAPARSTSCTTRPPPTTPASSPTARSCATVGASCRRTRHADLRRRRRCRPAHRLVPQRRRRTACRAASRSSRRGSRCPDVRRRRSGPYDNVPVLSWLLLRGRCRDCGSRSPRATRSSRRVTAVLLARRRRGARSDDARDSSSALVLVLFLVPMALIDLDHRIIPNRLTGPGGGRRRRARARARPARASRSG